MLGTRNGWIWLCLALCAVLLPLLNVADAQACPVGWYQGESNKNKCYKMVTATTTNWIDAEHICQSIGYQGHLVSIGSAFERNELKKIAQYFATNDSTNYNDNCLDLWIGLADVHLDGSYEWSDGTPYLPAAANWAPGYPRPASSGNNEYCVQADLVTPPSQWRNVNCVRFSNCYMCESTPVSNNCPAAPTGTSGWHQNTTNGLCYLVNLQPLPWALAEEQCTNYQGSDGTPAHLASVLSEAENTYVLGLAASSLLTTSSPDCDYSNGWFWIGLNNTNKWSDGNLVGNYSNAVAGNTTGCVEMVTGNCRDSMSGQNVRAGRWSYQPCAGNLPYICKIPGPIPTVPPGGTTTGGPAGNGTTLAVPSTSTTMTTTTTTP